MSCLACKNKLSSDRCALRAVPGFPCCKRHSKTANTRMWLSTRPTIEHYIRRFQSIWRGYRERIPILLAGPGVLKRSVCMNEDELSTLDSKNEVHPHDYFSIDEDGKVFWFDQRTMIQWSQKELEIRNPYTRSLVSNTDLRRFRRLWTWRKNARLPLYHEGQQTTMTMIERRDNRWLRIAQIIRECGFDIHHENFISMSYPQTMMVIHSLVEDSRAWLCEKKSSIVHQKYHLWLKNLRNVIHSYASFVVASTDVAGVLLAILQDMVRSPDDFAFYIYSAHARSDLVIRAMEDDDF